MKHSKLVNNIANKTSTLINGKTTNLVESCNSAIASACLKHFDYPRTYSFHVMCGALTFSEKSPMWKADFMLRGGYEFFPFTKNKLSKEAKRKERDYNRRQTEESKTRKSYLKGEKRKRNKTQNREKGYHGGVKEETEMKKCQCKQNEEEMSCISNHCGCKRSKCSSECKCKGENCANNKIKDMINFF